MLKVVGVTHRYRHGPVVLHDVTFVYPRHGVLALVGPSGSGKTTLLNILGGILAPSDGGAVDRGVAYGSTTPTWVFQTPNVLAHRTTVQNAALGALAAGVPWAGALVDATNTLDSYGLAPVTDSKAKTLSGGEIQRLVLARAELLGTPLLLADEPTGQLDHDNTAMVVRALRRLADRGTTVVVATHDPLVEAAADACVTIENAMASYVDRT